MRGQMCTCTSGFRSGITRALEQLPTSQALFASSSASSSYLHAAGLCIYRSADGGNAYWTSFVSSENGWLLIYSTVCCRASDWIWPSTQ
ncbi:hypothetical protein PVAP13_5KG205721 [Panicum virgatum]|uniref:Uncharacterized protein n=1 Tax=Panicum virgatum TaxID=38727 RepID=A0A8T0SLD1_PANVG|nr:hypothetical protein PVAP13_5KG205721 [Panicum virgatum]